MTDWTENRKCQKLFDKRCKSDLTDVKVKKRVLRLLFPLERDREMPQLPRKQSMNNPVDKKRCKNQKNSVLTKDSLENSNSDANRKTNH